MIHGPVTKSYLFETPTGTFWIRPHPSFADRWQLGIDQTVLGSYASARAAASSVAGRSSGFEPWDKSTDPAAPADVSKWRAGAEPTPG